MLKRYWLANTTDVLNVLKQHCVRYYVKFSGKTKYLLCWIIYTFTDELVLLFQYTMPKGL